MRAKHFVALAAGLVSLAAVVSCAGPRANERRSGGGDFIPHASEGGSAPISSGFSSPPAHGGDEAGSGAVGGNTETGEKVQADNERAIAVGLLLDSAPSAEAIDEGLAIAAVLRRCYGLEGDDSVQGREALARRARRDILDRLELSEADIRTAAASLGYSLEPDRCGNTCENVRNLAVLELEKQALRALAKAPPGSCPERGAAAQDPVPAR